MAYPRYRLTTADSKARRLRRQVTKEVLSVALLRFDRRPPGGDRSAALEASQSAVLPIGRASSASFLESARPLKSSLRNYSGGKP